MFRSTNALHRKTAFLCAAALILAACSENTTPTSPNAASRDGSPATGVAMQLAHARVCPGSMAQGFVRCHSWVAVDPTGNPFATTNPGGYNPADLQSAYGLSSNGGSGQTIAIVDAYDDGNAESDLAVYRSAFGLPPCTTANGCFKKIDQDGGTNYPRGDAGWAEEISLDLDMASAICPGCHILLVEAKSNSLVNLGIAVNRAASTAGVVAISNSYGASEFSSEASYQDYYNHPGKAVTVSSGDNGYGVEFPAASQYVTAVGGTSLTKSGNSWSEKAWSGAGSGCSAYISKPSWQQDAGCSRRTVADVSAVADPNTGVSVYDTFRLHPGGWLVFGGTSVAAPIIAAVYAVANNTASITYGSYPYSHTSGLTDITSGSNGRCGSYLCTAGTGYDGPTGLGTPKGTGAF
jgi:subtilase family serine protease